MHSCKNNKVCSKSYKFSVLYYTMHHGVRYKHFPLFTHGIIRAQSECPQASRFFFPAASSLAISSQYMRGIWFETHHVFHLCESNLMVDKICLNILNINYNNYKVIESKICCQEIIFHTLFTYAFQLIHNLVSSFVHQILDVTFLFFQANLCAVCIPKIHTQFRHRGDVCLIHSFADYR